MNPATRNKLVIAGVIGLLVLIVLGRCVKSVPAGHVAVATLFGDVVERGYDQGLHIVNPLYAWTLYDARQQTHKEMAKVPSQDQLTTEVDVSVQYRLNKALAPEVLRDTGTLENALSVHLVPKLRSLLREQGKSVTRAEDFFNEETQVMLQTNLQAGMQDYLSSRGIDVSDVLIRDIRLSDFIVRAIESKKEREQEAEKQKAELERFKTEQQEKVAQAEAELEAAQKEAETRRVLADAQAYEIQKVNEALANSPAYIQLQALESLKAISKDPAAKVYFLNGDSPTPLPLMHLGERQD